MAASTESPISTPLDSTTGAFSGIDSRYMRPVALYARVSTDGQKQEGTIESQVAELKRQIAVAGDDLVKEYLDDEHSGKYLDRPALDELRSDAKTNAFEAVYFLSADRIARNAMHQNIIVGELLKYKKRVIIGGKDYEENPENRFALTVLGAVAEFERAKISERMNRGRLHKIRKGQVVGQGHNIFGYRYVRRRDGEPPALVIDEKEAAIVRLIFEMYATGRYGQSAICRVLEQRGVTTKKGSRLWAHLGVARILRNATYAGTRYYNMMTGVRESTADGTRQIRKWPKMEYRDRAEWIGVNVPAIVSRELFDKVQERLRYVAGHYRKPPIQSLLSGFVRCGECGRLIGCAYSWEKFLLANGDVAVKHRGRYRCSKRAEECKHDPSNRGRCHNVEVATTILDNTVVRIIRDAMLDPQELSHFTEGGDSGHGHGSPELARVAGEIERLNERRGDLFEAYAARRIARDEYVSESRELDRTLLCLRREQEAASRTAQQQGRYDLVSESIRHFCASARTHFETCADFDAKRKFLRDHIEKIVFDRGKITICGAMPLLNRSDSVLRFRIEGAIAKGSRRRWLRDQRFGSWVPLAQSERVSHSIGV
jgi:site-specific DNA recombinase